MKEPTATITTARRSLSQEQAGRTRKYLISMGIRTVCVIAAIFVPGWPRWVFIAGAVFLPYFAVVIANAGSSKDDGRPDLVDNNSLSAPSTSSGGTPAISGTVVFHSDATNER